MKTHGAAASQLNSCLDFDGTMTKVPGTVTIVLPSTMWVPLPEISVEYSRCVCECSGSLYPGLVRRYTVGPVDIGSAPMSATSAPGGILASSFSAGIHFASANCAT